MNDDTNYQMPDVLFPKNWNHYGPQVHSTDIIGHIIAQVIRTMYSTI